MPQKVGATCVWAGVDSVREQEKLEARKILENAAESHTSGARRVRQTRTTEPAASGEIGLVAEAL